MEMENCRNRWKDELVKAEYLSCSVKMVLGVSNPITHGYRLRRDVSVKWADAKRHVGLD